MSHQEECWNQLHGSSVFELGSPWIALVAQSFMALDLKSYQRICEAGTRGTARLYNALWIRNNTTMKLEDRPCKERRGTRTSVELKELAGAVAARARQ